MAWCRDRSLLYADSVIPKSRPQITKDMIQGWMSGLPAFDLAGLERAVFAGKGIAGCCETDCGMESGNGAFEG